MTLLHQAAQKAVEAVPRYNWDQDLDVLYGPVPDGEWVRRADVIAALQHQEVPREPVAGDLIDAADRYADQYQQEAGIPARDVRAAITNAFYAGSRHTASPSTTQQEGQR